MWGKMRSIDLSQEAENRIPKPHLPFIHFSKRRDFAGAGRGTARVGVGDTQTGREASLQAEETLELAQGPRLGEGQLL